MNGQLAILLFIALIALITFGGVCTALVTVVIAVRQNIKNRRDVRGKETWYSSPASTRAGKFPMLYIIGIFFLIVALGTLTLMISGMFYNSNFVSGKCTVVSKSMKREKLTITTGSTHTEYNSTTDQYDTVNDTAEVLGFHASFVLKVQDSNGLVLSNGQDVFHSANPDKGIEQAFLDEYQIGKTYGCWYYRFDPTQASFSQPAAPQGFLFFLIPAGFFLLIGIILIRIGERNLGVRRQQVVYNGRIKAKT